MSIFEKFNSQGMSPADAFEELCCQLFEYCGKGQKQFDDNWTYCNIRGAVVMVASRHIGLTKVPPSAMRCKRSGFDQL